MALPASGAIAFSDVNTELGYLSTAQISLNDTAVRTLFATASGAIDMNTGHGKSNTSVPGAPTGVSASATSSSAISVSFSAPACTGNLTIDSYQVVCTSSGSNSATGASSPISVTGLSASTLYTFKVRAHNSKGYGCYSGTASATTQAPPYMNISSVFGGTVTTCGNYKIATFTGSGNFVVSSLGSCATYGNKIWYLAVAGGGNGGTYGAYGNIGGGGGAGGFKSSCGYSATVTVRTYAVQVGAGGNGRSFIGCPTACGYSGSITENVYPGGQGGSGFRYYIFAGGSGGSGGGGSGSYICNSGGSPKCGQGYAGGNGAWSGGGKCGSYGTGSGGGGGAGGAGSNGSVFGNSGFTGQGGNGGAGRYSSITGSSVGYAGGGAGSGWGTNTFGYLNGSSGGSGGGAVSTAGTVNTGGGGGSAAYGSGSPLGGSGIVVIRWRFQ
jgi:hypothetical protein